MNSFTTYFQAASPARAAIALAALCAATLPMTAPAPAAAQRLAPALTSAKKWSVYAPENLPVRTCYAASGPIETESSRDGIKRGKAFLIVSTFPDEGVEEQVAVTLGYPANAKKPIELKIDSTTFKLFADGEEAWLESAEEDKKAVAAMRRGAKAWVTATSTRGTTITDEYSLSGFTAATQKAREYCKK